MLSQEIRIFKELLLKMRIFHFHKNIAISGFSNFRKYFFGDTLSKRRKEA